MGTANRRGSSYGEGGGGDKRRGRDHQSPFAPFFPICVLFDHDRASLSHQRSTPFDETRALQFSMSHTRAGSRGIRDFPAYTFLEAARYLDIPPATLRYWVLGKSSGPGHESAGSQPLIRAPANNRLSFNNLVEAHVLRALRTVHLVKMAAVRDALAYAERSLGIDRLLLREELRTSGQEVLLERLGQLISLTKSGQLAIRRILAAYLKRVERDESALPLRLFPLRPGSSYNTRTIVIDPLVSFGRPTVAGSGISTEALISRIDAGETVTALAKDYGLRPAQIHDAVLYERAA